MYRAVFVAALLAILPVQATAQRCEWRQATDATCLTLDYVRALMQMQLADRAAEDTTTSLANTFYGLKSQRAAAVQAKALLAQYRRSKDTTVASSAKELIDAFSGLGRVADGVENGMRRAAAGKMTSVQMAEGSAQIRVWTDALDQTFLLSTMGLPFTWLKLERGDTVYTRRQMTLAQRDSLVAQIDRLQLQSHSSTSRWVQDALALRDELTKPGWRYQP